LSVWSQRFCQNGYPATPFNALADRHPAIYKHLEFFFHQIPLFPTPVAALGLIRVKAFTLHLDLKQMFQTFLCLRFQFSILVFILLLSTLSYPTDFPSFLSVLLKSTPKTIEHA
jgi:hypothetical protein